MPNRSYRELLDEAKSLDVSEKRALMLELARELEVPLPGKFFDDWDDREVDRAYGRRGSEPTCKRWVSKEEFALWFRWFHDEILHLRAELRTRDDRTDRLVEALRAELRSEIERLRRDSRNP